MRRADRLFDIIQRLRRSRVVTARALAEQLGISERTVYRDVRDLIASGVPIEGEAGLGYSLRKGYDLPPLMFSESEAEALVFGARIVQSWTDSKMAQAADDALAKVASVLPNHLRPVLADRSLWAPATNRQPRFAFDLAELRAAIRSHRRIRFHYRDEKGAETDRKVRPLTLLFYPPAWVAGAWCELRDDFRFFRLERMSDVEFLSEEFPQEPGKTTEDLFQRILSGARDS